MRLGLNSHWHAVLLIACSSLFCTSCGGCSQDGNDISEFSAADKVVERSCMIAGPNPDRAQKLAVWTALCECYENLAKREASAYDLSGESISQCFGDCIVGVRRQAALMNGLFHFSVRIDMERLSHQIERPWVPVPVGKAEKESLQNRRNRLRKAVEETRRLLADYPARMYKATRMGMFEVSKGDKTESADATVDMTYDMTFCAAAFERLEKQFRTIIEETVCSEKTIRIEKYDESRIREEYESFWNEAGYDDQLGYRVVSFLKEAQDRSVELLMLIVPAQIYKAVRKSISADSVVEFAFRKKNEKGKIIRLCKAVIAFWREPYVDFADFEVRPIEFRNWISMEIGDGDENFTKREIRQGFKMPVDAIRTIDRCDIRVYSGVEAEKILKTTSD